MKLARILLAAAAAGEAIASWGSTKNAAYNKWHETELERWLSDHGIPYTTPADRKELERIVHDNWQNKVVAPYQEWDPSQLQKYLGEKGWEVEETRKGDKNWLVINVKKSWYETEAATEDALANVRDWIFDTWSDSQLKAFLDRHRIPNPSPRKRDTLLSAARENYQNVANKLGETSAYPGNWLYESWSESDLKKWLDEHGYPVPQPSTRDKLVSAVRRNSRLASLKLRSASDTAAKKAGGAKQSVSDKTFDTWSDSSLRAFLDKNGISIPQGFTRNELLALVRRNKAYYTDDDVYGTAESLYTSTTAVGNDKVAQATDAAEQYGQKAFDRIVEGWSDSRLKSYLDSRGVPVPQNGKREELLAAVRLNKHKAASEFGAWTFDTWSYDNLKKWLEAHGQQASENAKASRDDLYSSAVNQYYSIASSASSASNVAASTASGAGTTLASSASSAATKAASSVSSAASFASSAATQTAKEAYASFTSALAAATAAAKDLTFDTWSDSDLKAYLDSYGISTYQGTPRNELIALARRNGHAFLYGSQDQGLYGQIRSLTGRACEKLGGAVACMWKWAVGRGQQGADTVKDAYEGVREEL